MMIPAISTDTLTLDATLNAIWTMLLRGAEKATDPFHTPVLGTVGSAGCSLRTVVLRRVLETDRLLLCHTDRRSPKIAEVAKHPEVSWLFYHPEDKVQLRVNGKASLHIDDELADRQWTASRLMSRRCYCAADAPGTAVTQAWSGLPETLENRAPTATESEIGRPHFAVIAGQVTDIDWLYLDVSGHRRARFSWRADGSHATWLTP